LDPTVADRDDLPIFRPKFGKRLGATRSAAPANLRNAILANLRGAAARAGGRRSAMGRARIAVRPSKASSRRVVVKVHVAPLRAGGAKAAALHIRYIERDGVEKDGSQGVLYGADGPVAAKAFEAPRLDEEHQFRLIVSPEDAGELDLSLYVRRFMARVEKDLGQRLEWGAVNHFDTDHPHAHIVVRGVDRDAREVRMPRAYVASGLRDRAQAIATEELGPRPERDLARQRQREVHLDRFTTLDRPLERRAVGDRVEVRRGLQGRAGEHEALLGARLRHLEVMRLAERVGPSSWQMTPGWQQHLRDLGMRGDIIKEMHRALQGDLSRYRIIADAQSLAHDGARDSQVLYGRVAKKGLSDELRGSVFAIVESPHGGGYYVRLDKKAADVVREGDLVAVRARPHRGRAEDEEIQRLAQDNNGLYDPEAARKALDRQIKQVQQILYVDNSPTDSYSPARSRETMTLDEIAQSHERRLAELEKLGVVTRTSEGSWRLGEGFLERAGTTDARDVRPRVDVERSPVSLSDQVNRSGPTWLDSIQAEGLARYGFGAELRKAVANRNEALRAGGIDPGDADRIRRLNELERRTVARRIARLDGGAQVENIPDGFRGRLRIHREPGGSRYAEIRDGERFALVRLAREARAMEHQRVTVSRDAQGRLYLRALGLDRDRGRS
jgi:type IV secretory pathway VirD2 relaxase